MVKQQGERKCQHEGLKAVVVLKKEMMNKMAEYVGREPRAVDIGDPIMFENKTDDSFSVDVGIVFRKSGLYRVTVDDKYISVKMEPERKTGKWNVYYRMHSRDTFVCNRCGSCFVVLQGADKMNFCPNCGADMREEQNG